jgi:NAD-dependent dihydropyrimidine dehydrogenase PreA subunit
MSMATKVNIEKCDACGDCVETCPTESIKIVDDHAQIDHEECIDCEACIDACPNEAIYMIEEEVG